MTTWFARILVAPLLILGVFFVYAYGLDWQFNLIDFAAIKRYYQSLGLTRVWVQTLVLLSMIVPHFLLVAGLSCVFSRLATKAYGEHAIWIAVLAALPVVAIRSYELIEDAPLLSYSNFSSFVLSVFEIASFAILICLGTWLSARRLAAVPQTPHPLAASATSV